MPSSTDYLHPRDRMSIPDDSGSEDDDLDLEELDPDSSIIDPPSRTSRDDATRRRNYGPGIAMRNLRSGIGNRVWRRNAPGPHRGAPEEDLQGLLEGQEEGGLRRSQASSQRNFVDDDAPLLHDGRRGSARSFKGEEQTRSQFRLPGFKPSNILNAASIRLVGNTSDDPAAKPPREVSVGQQQSAKYPPNVVSNAKYTPWSFLPRTLYNEFSFFFNIYFLLVALSQIIPVLRIGYMSSYIAPLAFVVSISLGKEAMDDIGRRRRDAEANSEEFTVLNFDTAASASSSAGHPYEMMKRSRDLKVGDILKMRKNQRLPADVVILKSISSDASQAKKASVARSTDLLDSNQETSLPQTDGEPSSEPEADKSNVFSACDTFIRTDQLDGETDWKLRMPSVLSQTLPLDDLPRLKVTASAPDQKVNEFVGAIELLPPPTGFYDPHIDETPTSPMNAKPDSENPQTNSAPLSIDNTAWANTVLASNTVTYAAIIYTGSQTRAALSTSPSRSKVGLLEYEINSLTKILCILTLTLSVILVALEGFQPTNDKEWYIAIMIYLILFSTIIPMSLRVNLDMAKSIYGRFIERDNDIPGTVVRTSTIPEDLGRIEYLLSDKTGTLTQNGELC